MGAAATRKKNGTIVEEIVGSLCHGIFRGEYEVGSKLPPLRTLAKTFDVTLPTMQRVIARMEELGVIAVRQGSGVTVLDPQTNAHPSALTYWLEALRDRPAEAARLLSSFLELRTELGVAALLKVRRSADDEEFDAIIELIDDFEARAREGMTPEEACGADFAVMRRVLKGRHLLAYSAVLNIFARLLQQMPELQQAMYDPPSRNAKGWRVFFGMVREPGDEAQLREQITGVLNAFDMVTLAKFEAILARGGQ